MRRGERPLLQLPRPLLCGFIVLFVCQLAYHHTNQAQITANYRALPQPFSTSIYRGMAMGSEQLLSYLLALRLQLHDNQLGQHWRYSLIDYAILIEWLERISDLGVDSEYPMLLASRIYTQTGDSTRLRQLLDFIERRFDDNPQLHWRRLTEASLLAKHKLGDLQLALRLASKLAQQADNIDMPDWARDFEFLLLAELNEFEASIAIIIALLKSDAVTDPDELRFLQEKLLSFQQKLFELQQEAEK